MLAKSDDISIIVNDTRDRVETDQSAIIVVSQPVPLRHKIGKYAFMIINAAASDIFAFAIASNFSTPYPWLTFLYKWTPLYAGTISSGRVSKLIYEYYQSSWSKEKKKILILIPASLLTAIPNGLITWHQYNGNAPTKIVFGVVNGLSSAVNNNYGLINGTNKFGLLFVRNQHYAKIKLSLLETIKRLKYKLMRKKVASNEILEKLRACAQDEISLEELVEILKEIKVDQSSASYNIAALLIAMVLAAGAYPYMCETSAGLQILFHWSVKLIWFIVAGVSLPGMLLSMTWVYGLLNDLPHLFDSYAWKVHPLLTGLLYLIIVSPVLFSYAASVALTKFHILSPGWQWVTELVSSSGAVFFNVSSLPLVIDGIVLQIGKHWACGVEENRILAEIYSEIEEILNTLQATPPGSIVKKLSPLNKEQQVILVGREARELLKLHSSKPGLIRSCYDSCVGFFVPFKETKKRKPQEVSQPSESSPLISKPNKSCSCTIL